jgi:hypothetical protein
MGFAGVNRLSTSCYVFEQKARVFADGADVNLVPDAFGTTRGRLFLVQPVRQFQTLVFDFESLLGGLFRAQRLMSLGSPKMNRRESMPSSCWRRDSYAWMVKYAETTERLLPLLSFSVRKSATLPRWWLSLMPLFRCIEVPMFPFAFGQIMPCAVQVALVLLCKSFTYTPTRRASQRWARPAMAAACVVWLSLARWGR